MKKILLSLALIFGLSNANAQQLMLNADAVRGHIDVLNQQATQGDAEVTRLNAEMLRLKTELQAEALRAAPGQPERFIDRPDPEAGPVHTPRYHELLSQSRVTENAIEEAKRRAKNARGMIHGLNNYERDHAELAALETHASNNPGSIAQTPTNAKPIHALRGHLGRLNQYIRDNNLHRE